MRSHWEEYPSFLYWKKLSPQTNALNVKLFTTMKPRELQSFFLCEEASSVRPLICLSVRQVFLRNCKNCDNSGEGDMIFGQFATFDQVCRCLVASYYFTKAYTQLQGGHLFNSGKMSNCHEFAFFGKHVRGKDMDRKPFIELNFATNKSRRDQ